MAKDEDPDDDLDLPDKDAAKGFYAKYEPKEILGRYGTTATAEQMCRGIKGKAVNYESALLAELIPSSKRMRCPLPSLSFSASISGTKLFLLL